MRHTDISKNVATAAVVGFLVGVVSSLALAMSLGAEHSRTNYFTGKLLHERDFEAEQKYQIEKRHLEPRWALFALAAAVGAVSVGFCARAQRRHLTPM